MFALLAALVLTVPAGESGALDGVADGENSAANVNSSLTVSSADSGNPSQEALDPPPEDPPAEDPPPEDPPAEDPPPEGPPADDPEAINDPPIIMSVNAMITSSSTLSVDGLIGDEEPAGVIVRISWLGTDYEVNSDSTGQFTWQIAVGPSDEGWLTVVAIDSTAQESSPAQYFIFQP